MAVPFNNGMRNMGPPQFEPHGSTGGVPFPTPAPIDQADQTALNAAILHLHKQTLDAIVKHHRQKNTGLAHRPQPSQTGGVQAPRY